MSYEKYEWKDGDIITAERLNHMEAGLSSADPTYVAHTWTDGEIVTENLFDALEAGIAALNVNYSRHDWATGEEITAAKLNHMEQGIYLGSVTLKTVLYTDGTLIINEDPADRTANIVSHGAVDTEYPALDKDHDYVFEYDNEDGRYISYWEYNKLNINVIEIGTEVKPTSIYGWFDNLSQCNTIILDNLNTSSLTSFNNMFSRSAITSLDVSGFDTSSVTNMNGMFNNCKGLTTIVASDTFVVNADAESTTGMFQYCTNLIGGNGTTYSADHTNGEYARIDTAATPGYFTAA